VRVAFDIDGCLLSPKGMMRNKVFKLIKLFKDNGDDVILWSGGGAEYANRIRYKFNLIDIVRSHTKDKSLGVDIAFDDKNVKLGKVNIKI
jgi:hypothetical protein